MLKILPTRSKTLSQPIQTIGIFRNWLVFINNVGVLCFQHKRKRIEYRIDLIPIVYEIEDYAVPGEERKGPTLED